MSPSLLGTEFTSPPPLQAVTRANRYPNLDDNRREDDSELGDQDYKHPHVWDIPKAKNGGIEDDERYHGDDITGIGETDESGILGSPISLSDYYPFKKLNNVNQALKDVTSIDFEGTIDSSEKCSTYVENRLLPPVEITLKRKERVKPRGPRYQRKANAGSAHNNNVSVEDKMNTLSHFFQINRGYLEPLPGQSDSISYGYSSQSEKVYLRQNLEEYSVSHFTSDYYAKSEDHQLPSYRIDPDIQPFSPSSSRSSTTEFSWTSKYSHTLHDNHDTPVDLGGDMLDILGSQSSSTCLNPSTLDMTRRVPCVACVQEDERGEATLWKEDGHSWGEAGHASCSQCGKRACNEDENCSRKSCLRYWGKWGKFHARNRGSSGETDSKTNCEGINPDKKWSNSETHPDRHPRKPERTHWRITVRLSVYLDPIQKKATSKPKKRRESQNSDTTAAEVEWDADLPPNRVCSVSRKRKEGWRGILQLLHLA
ncbi:uncharacterized protein I206_102574 [Kwoniella pini CBS 10737]|uniref:Uncharacterized protein n=1 Tax=Kwoniella pini CBS 10737 TaxID=1296096 RepID=A0A1B9I5R6_9TREE|nr:uncharacterized protein I206_02925 [Kwoniella pini CBS 10737]OCF50867.1 hypothetical protein I206_02925 [Kwoniella pini CBS 10737]